MISLEPYQQSHTYDTGNNLIHLSHQAKSNTWQQTLTIHPNSNLGCLKDLVMADSLFGFAFGGQIHLG
jgi:hypothetical protein